MWFSIELAPAQQLETSRLNVELSNATSALRLPAWLTLSGVERLRLERPQGIGHRPGAEDFYALSRFRLDLGVNLGHAARLYVETQDARVGGYTSAPAPSTVQNPFDLRQFYVEYGDAEKPGMHIRVGRQGLSLAGNWVIGPSEWSNTSRTFDAALAAVTGRGWQADLFAGSVILAESTRLDRPRPGEHIRGGSITRQKSARLPHLETFLLVKQQPGVTAESGRGGDALLNAAGLRSLGSFGERYDYHALYVRQWGHYNTDPIRAWAADAAFGVTLGRNGWRPRLSAECSLASGDEDPRDGSHDTFDSLYGSFHTALGTAERLGWRNSRNLRVGLDFTPSRKWKVTLDARDLALLTTADGLYDGSGARESFNPTAPSLHVGVEVDAYFIYEYRRSVSLGAGLGYLKPGAYLRTCSAGAATVYPYVMLTKRF